MLEIWVSEKYKFIGATDVSFWINLAIFILFFLFCAVVRVASCSRQACSIWSSYVILWWVDDNFINSVFLGMALIGNRGLHGFDLADFVHIWLPIFHLWFIFVSNRLFVNWIDGTAVIWADFFFMRYKYIFYPRFFFFIRRNFNINLESSLTFFDHSHKKKKT